MSLFRAIAGPIAASIAFVMELTLVPLILPAIQSHYDLSLGSMAWVFNAYGIAVAVGVIAGGWIGDAFGAKRIFGIGVLMFALGAAIVASSASFEALIAGRVLQGFGGGVFSPLVPLLLTKALPLRPGKILIIWGSVTGYVAAFAPFAAGQVVAFVGWQSVFVFFVVLSGAVLLLSAGNGATQTEAAPRTTPNLFLLTKARVLWLVFGYIFCTYGAITFYLFRLPLLLAETNYTVETIGVVLATIWMSFSIVGTLLRNWVDGSHIRSIVLAAPVLIAASFLTAYLSSDAIWLMISAILIGAGFACSNAPSTQLVLKFAPPGLSVISASLDITFARLGGVVTVAWLAQSDFSHSVLVIAGLSLAAVVFAMVFLRRSSEA
ncbi:MFS transporter [uncultured Roseobacter sp.]|uniref:MFS transporter n=1 Tax=uncultured Roseobacter sp. TaxID=114847 RepID=UPI002614C5F3|nr:MFS transporter [uncultured Roseobacter sp.]